MPRRSPGRGGSAGGLALLAVLLSGCGQPAGEGERAAATDAPAAMPASPQTAAPAAAADLPLTIDEEPVATTASAIVAQRDETVSGQPACAFDVRYKGAVDQPVVWNGEPCSAVTAAFIDAAKLAELGRYERLPEEARDDLARSGGAALYVEGGSTASLYPLNSAGRIYEVPLAD